MKQLFCSWVSCVVIEMFSSWDDEGHSRSIRANSKGANAQNVSFETFYSGQFALSTQLIILS